MARPITKPTVRRLRAVAAKAIVDAKGRYDDEAYRARLWNGFGVRSTLDLSEAQGKRLTADLLAANPRRQTTAPRPSVPRPSGDRYEPMGGGRATRKQLRFLAGLEDALGWTDQPERLRGFIRRQLRLADNVELLTPASLTPKMCSTVISGLVKLRDEGRAGDRPSFTERVAGAYSSRP